METSENPAVQADDPFAVISTAAVDVIPRGAVLTHANLLASNLQTMASMGLTETDVNLLALPLFHVAALNSALAIMHAGGANVLMSRFDAEHAVRSSTPTRSPMSPHFLLCSPICSTPPHGWGASCPA